ncbi:MAG: NAD(P)H-binding protein [Gammaproteobacteria bacterium]|nr:NAD(P)H-binding protein [Gammaproteobacteria bacterium]
MKVAIIGGTGFVGGYLVDALLDKGHEPSLLVRPGSFPKVRRQSECRIVEGDLASPAAIRACLDGCAAVIYNVGILREFPRRGITFEASQYDGVVRTIAAAQATGIRRMLLMSANGVKLPGTPYQETKYRAEQALQEAGLDWTVFRPSVIFGEPRGTMEIATQLYRDMIQAPLPAVGLHTGLLPSSGQILLSPVHVRDVADAFVSALDQPGTIGRTLHLGGPEALSWTQMLQRIAAVVSKRKLVLPMPIAVMKLAATLLDWLPFFPATREQLTMLAEGNAVGPQELQHLIGREATAFATDNLAYLKNASTRGVSS